MFYPVWDNLLAISAVHNALASSHVPLLARSADHNILFSFAVLDVLATSDAHSLLSSCSVFDVLAIFTVHSILFSSAVHSAGV